MLIDEASNGNSGPGLQAEPQVHTRADEGPENSCCELNLKGPFDRTNFALHGLESDLVDPM
jgi:hypothetical protein